uniref:Uncharacterized protein n=1 Tax=Candidatus Kentrum sp. TUN TaxID=2126343 RepID=A0A450ZHU9_9GAMM|nr:MAG: hypothetical protein BECKTUN1418F_GA0071002_10138 [Candidatus Kentron sp. TUN]VFK53337.1 MAG: hypothetical protein BECKTUN1418E_GA0071001_10158 [Candidatus Kentron sp. TUN]VFK58675.1 MAG: hypothetical protein BECKTUN1418D_GA0071000_108711 [Candidatus Kentron sp. TUN]
MQTAEQIQSEIEALPHKEYSKLVRWFHERDWEAWDDEIENDVGSGRLDFLIEEALEEKDTGKLRDL